MGMYPSHRKYVLDLLSETGMLDSRPIDTPMDYRVKLDAKMGELFADVGQYKWLVGKLFTLLLHDQTSLMRLEQSCSLCRPLGNHIGISLVLCGA